MTLFSRFSGSLYITTISVNLAVVVVFSLAHKLHAPYSIWWSIVALLIALPISLWLTRILQRKRNKQREALEIALLNLKDNDYSTSLPDDTDPHWQTIVSLYNDVGNELRKERQTVYQRELMLDHVMQSSPMALVLTSDRQHILYSNNAARDLLNQSKAIDGENYQSIIKKMPPSFSDAVSSGNACIFSMLVNQRDELFHLSHSQFTLNNVYHHLYLIKNLTRELNRQEVDTWKKVIRVISHEINNALAPLSSMAHSGKMLAEDNVKLQKVFKVISERTEHLNNFIQGYARFAKLPKPTITQIDLSDFLTSLQDQWQFKIENYQKVEVLYGDIAQLEHVFTNLLKNAQESDSSKEEINVRILSREKELQIDICDRGQGMSESVLKNALLPFYSTKQNGTGLGLALCREIIEAHDGRVQLANRELGGLKVSIFLPNNALGTSD